MKRHLRFWLLVLLGTCICIPFLLLAMILQMVLASALLLAALIVYCHLLCRRVYERTPPKYPLVPPEGRTDIYFPRTDISRPIHEDVRRYPEFFERRGRKPQKAERAEKARRKK